MVDFSFTSGRVIAKKTAGVAAVVMNIIHIRVNARCRDSRSLVHCFNRQRTGYAAMVFLKPVPAIRPEKQHNNYGNKYPDLFAAAHAHLLLHNKRKLTVFVKEICFFEPKNRKNR